MKRPARKRPSWADMRRDDSGAALILALIIVTVVAISIGALLTYSDTNIRTTVNLRSQAAMAYEADGAMQAAINNIRNSTANGSAANYGGNCFSNSTNTMTVSGFSGSGDTATVNCSVDPAAVLIQCVSLSQCNRPGDAILTTGNNIPGEDGINVQATGQSALNVHGTVFSNSNINVQKGSLSTDTPVYARGACSGTITSVPSPASCNYGATANSLGNDPGYQPATTTVPVHQPLPACTTKNSVVTFQPGYYDDAVGLSNMMSGNSACKGSTWWFKPGVYYFDFHNGGTDVNPLLSSAGDVWTMNDKNGSIVAGTPTNSAGKIVATPSVPASIPGACDNPINDSNAVGVQFIFGGDSQLSIKFGQAEICGTYSATKPPVAVYGLTSGTATTTSLTGVNTLKTTSVVSATTFTNATVANLANVDGQFATMVNNGNGNQSGSVTVAGYAPPSAIPAGSILKSAQLRVVHGNTAGSTNDSLSAQLTPSGGTAINVTVPSYGDNVIHTDTIDVSGGGTNSLAQAIYNGTFTGAQLTYSASVKHKGTEELDAMQLDLTYEAPAFRAENGCITQTPYPSTGCALILSQNGSGNEFYVQGTTYAPNAPVDITLNNAAEEVFRFGVVARTLRVTETGSFAYIGPVIEVPDDTPGFVFSVFLNVTVCPSGGCASGTKPMINARVAFVDGDPTTPVPGSRQVSILSWSGPR